MRLSKVMDTRSPDTSSNFPIPYRRIGLTLGALSLTQWAVTDLVHVPLSGIGILALGTGVWWLTSSS